MSQEENKGFWCPFGRISMQQVSNDGHTSIVPGGAFNIAVIPSLHHGGKETVYPSTRCIGTQCPFFDRRAYAKEKSFCRMASNHGAAKRAYLSASIIAVAILSTGSFIGLLMLSSNL